MNVQLLNPVLYFQFANVFHMEFPWLHWQPLAKPQVAWEAWNKKRLNSSFSINCIFTHRHLYKNTRCATWKLDSMNLYFNIKSKHSISKFKRKPWEVVRGYVHFKQSHLLGRVWIRKNSMFGCSVVKLEREKKEVFVLLFSSNNFQVFMTNYSRFKHDNILKKNKTQ